MSIEGRISVDALFHDKNGTSSLKVVSLQDADQYLTGKVAYITGTIHTATVTISLAPTSYKDASGDAVSIDSISRVVFTSTRAMKVEQFANDMCGNCGADEVSIIGGFPGGNDDLTLTGDSAGTATYRLVIYGS